MLPESQAGFRKGRSTIDNIYILNNCVHHQLNKKEHIFATSIDFRAAFDNVNREKLFKIMATKGISAYLIDCVREIYRATPSTIGKSTFYTTKGVKQGCPLSPILFDLYISEIDERFKKAQAGGVVIDKNKIFTLAYADDMLLLAKTESEMREMLRILAIYLKHKELTLNNGKTKIMRFGTK